METKLGELAGKFKALNFVVGNMDDILTAREKEPLKRKEISISKKIRAIYALQEEIEELKFIPKDSEDNVRAWANDCETKLNEAKSKVENIKRVLVEIEEEEILAKREKDEASLRMAIDAETEKQLAIEKARLELERVHKEAERQRELEHQDRILQQKIKFQKSMETSMEKSREVKILNYLN